MRCTFYLLCLCLTAFSSIQATTVDEDCVVWITCEDHVNIALPEDGCTVILNPSDLTDAGTHCGIVPIVTILNPGPYTIGTHNYTARASFGPLNATCSGQVTVEDKTAPNIICHDEIIYTNDPQAAWDQAVRVEATDNCDDDPGRFALVVGNIRYGTFTQNWWSTDVSQNTSYCTSRTSLRPVNESYCSPEINSDYEYIDWVRVDGLGSDDIYNFSENNNGYGYYVNHEARVGINRRFRLQAEAGGSNTLSLGWEVFIDFNNDGDYSDLGERVHHSSGSGHTNLDVDIFVPLNFSYIGKRRMRVFIQYAGTDGPCQAGAYGYGEYEDYMLDIEFPIWNPWGGGLRPTSNEDIATAQSQSINTATDDMPAEAEIDPSNTISTTTISSNHRIYPNPAQANVPVNVQLDDNHGLRQLRIVSSLGQEVARVAVQDNGAHTLEIPTNLPAGFYLINGLDADGRPVWTERLVLR